MDSQDNALDKVITPDPANGKLNEGKDSPKDDNRADAEPISVAVPPEAPAEEQPTEGEATFEIVGQAVAGAESSPESSVEGQPAEGESTPETVGQAVAAAESSPESAAEGQPDEGEKIVSEEPVDSDVKPQPTAAQPIAYATKREVVERLRQLAHGDEMPRKDEVEQLKTIFYKLHRAGRDAELKEYIDAGGDPEKYQLKPDEDEVAFKAEMSIVREKRAKLFQEQEAQKQANLARKLEIIERIKAMATSPDEANKSYREFRQLQQEWKELKLVPAEKASELWRNYQFCVEQFYDLLNLNREARELDFKKNLEAKTRLCEAAEKLCEEEDVVSAFHQLQKLHQEYRETGPVAKEKREEIWARFKAASTIVNKRHQQHFEELRAKEEENLAKKTALCEQVEAIAAEENKGAADFERHSKAIIAIQAEWKTIGFAPQKMNVKIFERFRAACDSFFGRKAEYFKKLRETFAENVEKKKALVMQAQELQDSTDWKGTADKLIALQKEWKSIGIVPRKQGDQLWSDFLAACNKFFNARNAATSGTRAAERENLQKKRSIIEKLTALADSNAEDMQEQAQQLSDEYNAIGHVPFKEKDKVYKEYRDIVNRLYKEFNVSVARRRIDGYRNSLKNMAEKGAGALDSERARLMRRYEAMKQDVQTYENNMGFINASSEGGSSLVDEMRRKVERLKDDINLVREKIKAIDAENADKADAQEETEEG